MIIPHNPYFSQPQRFDRSPDRLPLKMGGVSNCCKLPPDATADPRAALRAGGRIRISRNDTEDPRAPLLKKKPKDEPPKPLRLDPDMEAFINILSSGSDEHEEDENDTGRPLAKLD
jgi:hypothetical protein